MYADAVWDHDAQDTDELTFKVGDVIEILDMTDDVWWQGSVQNATGWFPASFVRVRYQYVIYNSQNNSLPLLWCVRIFISREGAVNSFWVLTKV